MLALNAAARAASCAFILAEVRGALAYVFDDFGTDFLVTDTNGENPSTNMIASITTGEATLVTVADEARLNLDDGGANADEADRVTFSEVEGAGFDSLNDLPPQRVRITGPFTFELLDVDSRAWAQDAYKAGSGNVLQAKAHRRLAFKDFAAAADAPEFVMTDFAKFDTMQLHLLTLATYDFAAAHDGRLPSADDVDELVALTKTAAAAAAVELDEALVRRLGRGAAGSLQPLVAALGGVVAQEVLKACSGKFMPVRQFAYFDAREVLPSVEEGDKMAKAGEFKVSSARVRRRGTGVRVSVRPCVRVCVLHWILLSLATSTT